MHMQLAMKMKMHMRIQMQLQQQTLQTNIKHLGNICKKNKWKSEKYSTNQQNIIYIEMEMHIEANTGMPNQLHLQLQMQN